MLSCRLVPAVISFRLWWLLSLVARALCASVFVCHSCGSCSPTVGHVAFLLSHLSEVDLAVRSGLSDGLAESALLSFGEVVSIHRQCLEGGLSVQEGDQRCHAFISVLKPLALMNDVDLAQGLDGAISERSWCLPRTARTSKTCR